MTSPIRKQESLKYPSSKYPLFTNKSGNLAGLSLAAAALVTLAVTGCGSADFAGGSGKNDKVVEEEPQKVLGENNAPFSQQISEQEVLFGSDKVFHIGDNNYPSSSCKEQIDTYKISGNRYFFEFEVKEPQTTLDIKIKKVCGIDYSGSNNALLMSGNSVIKKIPLAPGVTTLDLQPVTVQPGKYAVVVESLKDFKHIRRGDFDDFLVGNIDVKANKKIVAGAVRTQ